MVFLGRVPSDGTGWGQVFGRPTGLGLGSDVTLGTSLADPDSLSSCHSVLLILWMTVKPARGQDISLDHLPPTPSLNSY